MGRSLQWRRRGGDQDGSIFVTLCQEQPSFACLLLCQRDEDGLGKKTWKGRKRQAEKADLDQSTRQRAVCGLVSSIVLGRCTSST